MHRWGLGFRQSSFRPITRALRGGTFGVFQRPPLFGHALVPSGFRLQVNPMAQKHSSEFLLAAPGIQHRVPRRTLSRHTAPRIASRAQPQADRNTAESVYTPRRAASTLSRPFTPATFRQTTSATSPVPSRPLFSVGYAPYPAGFPLPFGRRHSLPGTSSPRWRVRPSLQSAYWCNAGCQPAFRQTPSGLTRSALIETRTGWVPSLPRSPGVPAVCMERANHLRTGPGSPVL